MSEVWTCPICKKTDIACYLHWEHIKKEHEEYYDSIKSQKSKEIKPQKSS